MWLGHGGGGKHPQIWADFICWWTSLVGWWMHWRGIFRSGLLLLCVEYGTSRTYRQAVTIRVQTSRVGLYYGGANDISNQDPRWTQKTTYTPIFTHSSRSWLLCNPVNSSAVWSLCSMVESYSVSNARPLWYQVFIMVNGTYFVLAPMNDCRPGSYMFCSFYWVHRLDYTVVRYTMR